VHFQSQKETQIHIKTEQVKLKYSKQLLYVWLCYNIKAEKQIEPGNSRKYKYM